MLHADAPAGTVRNLRQQRTINILIESECLFFYYYFPTTCKTFERLPSSRSELFLHLICYRQATWPPWSLLRTAVQPAALPSGFTAWKQNILFGIYRLSEDMNRLIFLTSLRFPAYFDINKLLFIFLFEFCLTEASCKAVEHNTPFLWFWGLQLIIYRYYTVIMLQD